MKKIILASLLATSALTHASDIIVSKGVKSNLRDLIEKDLNVLDNLKFKGDTSAEDLKIIGLRKVDTSSATGWLSERVNYVIEENAFTLPKLLIKKVISVERSGVTFPNQDVLPYGLANDMINEEEEKGITVMSNIGAGIYMGGKQQKQVYSLKISRGLLKKSIKAVVESPRVGIIQIGEGLFMPQVNPNKANKEAVANSIYRLGVFFHEARHSDGNGVSLGFTHSKCPAGHNLEGAYACDENLNGPYTVGAIFTAEMLKACGDQCSEQEKSALMAEILDSYSRVVKINKKGVPSTHWDATPESL